MEEEELKKVVRRLDSLQKTVDLMFSDRNLLEDILARLSTLENALHLNREHQTEMQKDTKADIGDVKNIVEAKIDEAITNMDEKTVVIAKNDNILAKIRKLFKKK